MLRFFSVLPMFQNRPEEDDGNKSSGPTSSSLAKISNIAQGGKGFFRYLQLLSERFQRNTRTISTKILRYMIFQEFGKWTSKLRSSANVEFRIFVPGIYV